jgi:hypothetical protein
MTGERAAERVRVDAFVKLVGDGRELVFRTRDLSEQGLFLYTAVTQAYPFKAGSMLDVELSDGDRQIACKVVVVRVVDPNTAEAASYPTGFGVRIVEITDEARAQIRALVARVKTSS